MQAQKRDFIFARVVLLEVPAPQQAAVVSCSQASLGAQRALPYCLVFPRMCDRHVGQRSNCVVTQHGKSSLSALSKH